MCGIELEKSRKSDIIAMIWQEYKVIRLISSRHILKHVFCLYDFYQKPSYRKVLLPRRLLDKQHLCDHWTLIIPNSWFLYVSLKLIAQIILGTHGMISARELRAGRRDQLTVLFSPEVALLGQETSTFLG